MMDKVRRLKEVIEGATSEEILLRRKLQHAIAWIVKEEWNKPELVNPATRAIYECTDDRWFYVKPEHRNLTLAEELSKRTYL